MGDEIGVNRNPLKIWTHPPGSNRRPADYESAALPTELGWLDLGLDQLRKSAIYSCNLTLRPDRSQVSILADEQAIRQRPSRSRDRFDLTSLRDSAGRVAKRISVPIAVKWTFLRAR